MCTLRDLADEHRTAFDRILIMFSSNEARSNMFPLMNLAYSHPHSETRMVVHSFRCA